MYLICTTGLNDGTIWHNTTQQVTMSSNIKIIQNCQYCGHEFLARTTVTKYCCHACNSRAYKDTIRKANIEKALKPSVIKKVPEKKDNTITDYPKTLAVLKEREFLSVTEVCILTGISRRTIYRMIKRNELMTAKFGSRTIILRTSINNLFIMQKSELPKESIPKPPVVTDWIGISETCEKYKVSSKALYDIIKRNQIPTMQDGIFVFISKTHIDKIFNPTKL